MKRLRFICALLSALVSTQAFSATFNDHEWPNGVVKYYFSSNAPLGPDALASFQAAIAYYESNTPIRFEQQSYSSDDFINVWGNSEGRNEATIGNIKLGICPGFCTGPFLTLDDDATVQTAIHEIFHSLGFAHEQSRNDRYAKVKIDIDNLEDTGEYSPVNWGVRPIEQLVGVYDPRSISQYRDPNMSVIFNDFLELTFLLAAPQNNLKRAFRLQIKDNTSSVFDNLELNIENWPSLEITDPESHWHSALWDLVPVSSGSTRFNIRSYWLPHDDKYLVDSFGFPALSALSSTNLNSPSAQWDLSWVIGLNGDYFTLKNVATGQYLTRSGSIPTYTTNASSAAWVIGAVEPYGPKNYLTPLDKLAIGWAYERVFRIQILDGTSQISDNLTIHDEYQNSDGSLMVEDLPESNGVNYWNSAMWALERKGTYFLIKNHHTDKYMYVQSTTNGVVTGAAGSIVENGISVEDSLASQWEVDYKDPWTDTLVIKNRQTGKYLVRNSSTGKLDLASFPTPNSNNGLWSFNWVDWNNYN